MDADPFVKGERAALEKMLEEYYPMSDPEESELEAPPGKEHSPSRSLSQQSFSPLCSEAVSACSPAERTPVGDDDEDEPAQGGAAFEAFIKTKVSTSAREFLQNQFLVASSSSSKSSSPPRPYVVPAKFPMT